MAEPVSTCTSSSTTSSSSSTTTTTNSDTTFTTTITTPGDNSKASTSTSTSSSSSSSTTSSNDAGSSSSSSNQQQQQQEQSSGESNFDCNICLDVAKDAVVSICGHLFCWPCLHQWFETKPHRPTCPVCKNAISREQVIPLYGRGSDKKDPREKKIPPRPAGQRSEGPEFTQAFPNFGFGDGFHMSFGIGAFPFGFFASTFNIGDFRAAPATMAAAGGGNGGGLDLGQDRVISNLFLWVAIIFIVWLFMA